MSLVCALSFILNQDSDFYFFIEICLYSIVFFFAAFFIKNVTSFLGLSYNYNTITKICVVAIVFQLFLSLLSYTNNNLFNFVFSIIDINLSQDTLDSFNQGRLVGIGASFFASGILNSFFLVLLAGFLVCNKLNITDSIRYYILAFLLSFIGVMASRTTIIGIILFLIISISRKPLFVFYSVFPLLFISIIVDWFASDSRLRDLLMFGTNFLFDYKNSQANDSTGALLEMLNIAPTNFKTWIIGDGFYHNNSGGYYMSTDVGYLRILFATGLIGLVVYIIAHLYLIGFTFWKQKKLICLSLITLFFALHVKGVANLMPLLFLYFIADHE